MLKFLSLLIALLVYCMETNAVPRSEFFQYGLSAGDQALRKEDDGDHDFDLDVPILFYSKSFNKLDITTNGLIAFGGNRHTSYTPHAFPRTDRIPVIAPFWSDLDTLHGGTVYYRISTTDSVAIQRVRSLVADHFSGFPNFSAEEVVVTTWDGVAGYCCGDYPNHLNTFQSVIATDGHNTFTLFLYLDGGIKWPDSSSDNHKAQAGFDAGDGTNFTIIEGSLTDDILNIDQKSNIGVPGLFIFKINGVIQAAEPSPSPIPIVPTSTAATVVPVLPTIVEPVLPALSLPTIPLFTPVFPISFAPEPTLIPVEPPVVPVEPPVVPVEPRPEPGTDRCYEEVIKFACRQLLDAADHLPQPVVNVGEPTYYADAPVNDAPANAAAKHK